MASGIRNATIMQPSWIPTRRKADDFTPKILAIDFLRLNTLVTREDSSVLNFKINSFEGSVIFFSP